MTKIKIYTEEQVIELTKAAFTAGQNHNSFIFSEELKNLTPIELPSDEEISKEAMDLFDVKSNSIFDILQAKAFKRGAIWLRNKIQGGNK